MATKLTDLDRYFSPGLTLTVLGREYTVPLASAELGLWCRRLVPAATRLHNASTEAEVQAAVAEIEALPEPPGMEGRTLPELLLGDTYQQMLNDGVPDPYVQYCTITALMYVLGGEELAARWWRSGGHPESLAPAAGNRAQRRAAARRRGGSSPTTSTAEASTTRSPGSGSGTNSRRSGRSRGSRGATS